MKKEWNCTGKIKNLIEPGDRNKIKVTQTDGEDNGEESGGTGAPQGNKIRRRCGSKSRQGFGFGLNKMKKEWNCTGKSRF